MDTQLLPEKLSLNISQELHRYLQSCTKGLRENLQAFKYRRLCCTACSRCESDEMAPGAYHLVF